MRSVGRCLRPGGALLLVDLHPLYLALAGTDPLVLDFPYGGAEPQSDDSPGGSYAAPDAELPPSVQYAHSLGEVVTAAVHAGLVVGRLVEHLETDIDARGLGLTPEPDGRYRLRAGGQPTPMIFTLVARRPRT
jgi:hypothetical protein